MNHLFTLNKYFWKYKWLFFLGIFFVVLTNYVRILSPQITGYVVNTVVESLNKKGAPSLYHIENNHQYNQVVEFIIVTFDALPYEKRILFSGLILLSLAIISGFFMFLMRQTIIVMSRKIEYDQKNEIYQQYQKLDISFYKKHSTGDLMNRISEDVSRVRMYVGPALMYFINLAAVIGFSLYFMLLSDVHLTMVALFPLPLLAITIYYVNSIINKKSEKIQSLLSTLTSDAQESYSGIRVIKSFVQEKSMVDYFEKKSEKYRQNALSLAKTEAIYFPSMGLLIGLSTLITVMVGGIEVAKGTEGVTIGKIAEFVLYIQMLTFPVSAIGWTASMTQRAAVSQKRINEFLLTQPLVKDAVDALDMKLMGDIKFEQVNFTYELTNIHALKNINFSIKKGEKIAIVGKTGSGKSTLAQLLLRMYNINNGQIYYDDVAIEKIKIKDIRNQICYVPQEAFLFSDTISNNIKFGKDSATQEEIINAAKEACIFDEIMSLPNGFETIIGERGVTLSGGQKQRISIARAMIQNEHIVIFDDCLSAVDSKTENQILENLNDFLQNTTAIIITHRIFTLLQFDRIIVLEDGQIAEIGTHDQLITQKGPYFELYCKQQSNENNT